MANKERGEYAFDAGGKSYTLRYSTNALCELEAILEAPFLDVITDFAEGKMSIVNTRALFYAGLQERHPDLSISAVGNLLDEVGMGTAIKAINEAVSLAFPVPGSGAKKKRTQVP